MDVSSEQDLRLSRSQGLLGQQSASRLDDIVEGSGEEEQNDLNEDEYEAWDVSDFKWDAKRKLVLFTMLLLLILLGSAETVTYTVNGKITMAPYRCFLNQFVVFICVIFFFALEWIQNRQVRANKSAVSRRGSEDLGYQSLDDNSSPWVEEGYDEYGYDEAVHSRREHPWDVQWRHVLLWFFVIAMCDTVSLYINLLASHNIGGALRLILQQLSIPISMMFSFTLLGRKFSFKHVVGALAVVLGVSMCMINVLKETPGQESSPLWTIMYGCSCIPLALGGCLKEWVLLKDWCGANEMNAYVAVFQLVLGFFLVPIGIMVQNKDMDGIRIVHSDEILQNFWSGFKCGCLGIDSFDSMGEPMFGQGHCNQSVISTWLYVFTVCSFNILMLWVIREGTAVLFFVANGVIIPLVGILSDSPLYKALGLHAERFTVWQFIGLCLTVLGCVYFGTAMIQRSEKDKREELLRSTSSRVSRQPQRDFEPPPPSSSTTTIQ